MQSKIARMSKMLGPTSATRGIMGLLEVDPFRRYREASARTRASLDELLSKEIAAMRPRILAL